MALTTADQSADTIGFTQVQASTIGTSRSGVGRIVREIDNTSSQSVQTLPAWHESVGRRLSSRKFNRHPAGQAEWIEADAEIRPLETLSSFEIPVGFDIMIEVLVGIARASELPAGWFEKESRSLSETAREAAIELVFLLASENLLATEISPDVIPTPIGGIQFEWAGKHGEIEVEIDSQGRFYTLVERPDGSISETPRSEPIGAAMVLPQIKRILT